jgi:hypothetical protein
MVLHRRTYRFALGVCGEDGGVHRVLDYHVRSLKRDLTLESFLNWVRESELDGVTVQERPFLEVGQLWFLLSGQDAAQLHLAFGQVVGRPLHLDEKVFDVVREWEELVRAEPALQAADVGADIPVFVFRMDGASPISFWVELQLDDGHERVQEVTLCPHTLCGDLPGLLGLTDDTSGDTWQVLRDDGRPLELDVILKGNGVVSGDLLTVRRRRCSADM